MTSLVSCNKNAMRADEGEGYINLHFSEVSYAQTKAVEEIPDTCLFHLSVTDSDGKTVYDGLYGDSPEKLLVKADTYNISVRSGEFSRPAFSAPLYGDDQCIVVKSGEAVDVWLVCEQQNSGLKLNIASDFLTSYPEGVLFLKAADGKLMYGYSEKRVAYFNPGKVSLILNDGKSDETMFTRTLKARQILVVNISVPKSSQTGGGLHIEVDTARNWISENYVIGGGSSGGGSGGSGSDYTNAYNVTQAKMNIGAEDVWVYGYIVGGDMTSASISFEEPFKSNTNIAIAGRTSVDDKEACFSVQLNKGLIRDALNLADNPENLRRKVYLKGDIVEAYFGIPGIKNVSDYVLE